MPLRRSSRSLSVAPRAAVPFVVLLALIASCAQIIGLDSFHDGICTPGSTRECPYAGVEGSKGVGVCRAAKQVCKEDGLSWGACDGTEILPALTDLCSNALDDDCDGVVNNGCACTPGDKAACYSGPSGTDGVGVCHAGTHTCNADGMSYGPCVGEQLPLEEDCSNALDDDCSGAANDGCPCAPGTSSPCYGGPTGTDGKGICHAGTQICNPDGVTYGACAGEQQPIAEDCSNALDDDCDGVVNNGCPCMPGSVASCYEGPSGTETQGTCHAGTKTCNPDGLTYGPCTGQQTPATEDCASGLDQNCDGFLCGETKWALQLGDSDAQPRLLVATDRVTGAIYLAGQFYGSVQLGATTYVAVTSDTFLAKLDSNRNYLWTKQLPSTVVSAIAVDANGNLIMAGGDTAGSTIVKLDPTGAITWTATCGAGAAVNAVATDPNDGSVIVAGGFTGTIKCGSGALGLTSAGGSDIFVAKLASSSGVATWTKRYGDGDPQSANGVALDANGSVFFGGGVGGVINFGVLSYGSPGVASIFIGKLSSAGAPLWAHSYVGAPGQGRYLHDLAVDSMGRPVFVGEFSGTMNIGGIVLTSVGGPSTFDGYIAQLDASGTAPVWAKALSGPAMPTTVAVDAAGDIVTAGRLYNMVGVDFGGGALTSDGIKPDIFVFKARANTGAHVWSRRFGDSNSQDVDGIAIAAGGDVLISGNFQGMVDFGGGVSVMSPVGDTDTFVAQIAP